MKYLKQSSKRNKTLTYQRRWPKEVATAAENSGRGELFSCATGCPVDASEVDKAAAQALGNREWEREVALLRVAKTGGLFIGGGNLGKKLRRKHTKVPKRDLYGLLEFYHLHNPEETKAGATRRRHWAAFLEHMGNVAADPKSLPAIHRGLDSWQDAMVAAGNKGSSIARKRNSVTAVLRWADVTLRLGWELKLRPVPKSKPKGKPVLSVAECQRLLATVAEEGAEGPAPTAAMVALMLAGGVMPTEIARLDPEAVEESLGATLPYVIIGAQGAVKAEARRRVVPVVWSEAVLRTMLDGLPVAIPRAAAAADSSATVNKWLRTRGFETTGHGLRHTLAAQAGKAMAHPLALARVGGWSAGMNQVMLSYGRDMAESELVRSLTEEVKRWWEPVLADSSDALCENRG